MEPTRRRPLFNKTDAKKLAQAQVDALNTVARNLNEQNSARSAERVGIVLQEALGRLGVVELQEEIEELEHRIKDLRVQINDLLEEDNPNAHWDFSAQGRTNLVAMFQNPNRHTRLPKGLLEELQIAAERRGIPISQVTTIPHINVGEIVDQVYACTTQEELAKVFAEFQARKLKEMGIEIDLSALEAIQAKGAV